MSIPVTKNIVSFGHLSVSILRYSPGCHLVAHHDMAPPGRKLLHLVLVLREAERGGLFRCDGTILSIASRLHLFRPDLYQHEVTQVYRGERVALLATLSFKSDRVERFRIA